MIVKEQITLEIYQKRFIIMIQLFPNCILIPILVILVFCRLLLLIDYDVTIFNILGSHGTQ